MNQQDQESCVAFAVAYAVKSYNERTKRAWPYSASHLFSPTFLYRGVKQTDTCDETLEYEDAFGYLQQNGVAPLSAVPFDSSECKHSLFDPQTLALARQFSIRAWKPVRITSPDDAKRRLAEGKPVLVGVWIDAAFKNLYGNSVYQGPSDHTAAHAIVLVGYDNSKGAFKAINSWGPDWAAKGFGWLSYALFNGSDVTEAWFLQENPVPIGVAMSHTIDVEVSNSISPVIHDQQVAAQESANKKEPLEIEITTSHAAHPVDRAASLRTEDHHCWYPWPFCNGEPTRHTYTLTLRADPGTQLRSPRLRCIEGDACRGWNEIRFVRLEDDGKIAIASWDVWAHATTWQLSAQQFTPETRQNVRIAPAGSQFTITAMATDPPPVLRVTVPGFSTTTLEGGRETGIPALECIAKHEEGGVITYTYAVAKP